MISLCRISYIWSVNVGGIIGGDNLRTYMYI